MLTCIRMLVVVALLISGSLAVGTSASAAPEVRTYSVSGTLLIGPPPALTLPAGSTFTATVDPATGAFTDGVVSIPTFPRGLFPPSDITIVNAAPANGTIDPATGVASVNATFAVTISVPLLTAVCTLGPVVVAMSTANPGGVPFAGAPPTGTVTAAGFAVPGVVAGPGCDPGAVTAINTDLQLPTSATSISLTSTLLPAPAPISKQPGFTG